MYVTCYASWKERKDAADGPKDETEKVAAIGVCEHGVLFAYR